VGGTETPLGRQHGAAVVFCATSEHISLPSKKRSLATSGRTPRSLCNEKFSAKISTCSKQKKKTDDIHKAPWNYARCTIQQARTGSPGTQKLRPMPVSLVIESLHSNRRPNIMFLGVLRPTLSLICSFCPGTCIHK